MARAPVSTDLAVMLRAMNFNSYAFYQEFNATMRERLKRQITNTNAQRKPIRFETITTGYGIHIVRVR